jgi:hypothetical protein
LTPEQARALVHHCADPQLEQAAKILAGPGSVLEARAFLEQSYDSSICLAILDCLSCRERFAHKFEAAERWLLAREASEQATDSRIANWRANALKKDGLEELVELGCGLGGDTVALSKQFEVKAWERCEARLLLARYNTQHLGRPPCTFRCAEVDCADLKGQVLFVDPARRDGARLSRPESWFPPLSKVIDCFREGRFQRVGVKVAPGITDRDLPETPLELTFLSIGGQLKEAFLVLDGSHDSFRQAVLFTQKGDILTFRTGHGRVPVAQPLPELYLHNPDPAILRANALDRLASQLEAGMVHPKIGYLVGPTPATDGSADSFKIVESFSLNWKTLKKRLATTGWSDYEYLGRGVPFGQAEVRNKLGRLKKNKDSTRGSVIVYREENGYRVVLARRYHDHSQDDRVV